MTQESTKEKDLFTDKSAAKMDEEDRKVKKIKDYLPEVTAAIPSIIEPLENDPESLKDVLRNLYVWEKKVRLAADSDSSVLVVETALNCCFKVNNIEELVETINILTKARAQLVRAVKAIVVTASSFLPSLSDADRRTLLKTLREVSDGKIFLELEHAHLTQSLVGMMEAEGDIASAADLLQTVAVETIGAMPFIERAEYLLEQLRLCLLKKDYLRAELVAKKIRTKQLAQEGWEEVKKKYFSLMHHLHIHADDWLAVAKCRYELYSLYRAADTKARTAAKEVREVKKAENESSMNDEDVEEVEDCDMYSSPVSDEDDWIQHLRGTIASLSLCTQDYDLIEFANRVLQNGDIVHIPAYSTLLSLLVSDVTVSWPLSDPVEVLNSPNILSVLSNSLFTEDIEHQLITPHERVERLRLRILEHNVLTASKMYSTIDLPLLASLSYCSQEDVEEVICSLVTDEQLYARIDRSANTVSLMKEKNNNQVLNEWISDIDELFKLVESTDHLINKLDITG